MESPIVGTFVMCFSKATLVAATNLRIVDDGNVDSDGDELRVVAASRTMRETAALLLDTNILAGRFRRYSELAISVVMHTNSSI